MIPGPSAKDLIVLAADKSMKLALAGLLARHNDLGIHSISPDIFAHPNSDPGVVRKGHDFLRPQCRRFRYAIAICDHDGCGKEPQAPEQIEAAIEQRLQANGWENRAAAIVIRPELEAWIWGDWSLLASFLRWNGGGTSLKNFLVQQKLLPPDGAKPPRPKEALQSAMRNVQIPFSSAIHQSMAEQAEFAQCVDRAFLKLQKTLRAWFPLR